MMKRIKVQQVDAFTDKLFGGNPAGVVFAADHLTEVEMKNIARELNLSETAFILNPTDKKADFKLRYFTSGKAEIKFCGHATISALYALAREKLFGMHSKGEYSFAIETNAGILPMNVIKKGDQDVVVQFTAPRVQLEMYTSDHKAFSSRLGIPFSAMNTTYPIMIDRNLNYLYLTINSLQELGTLSFDFQHIIDSFKKEKTVVFCLLTPETFDEQNAIHARGLAPLVGVPEDPFTGSMQAGIATYVRAYHLLADGITQFRTEQGHFIERPGFATIDYPQNAKEGIMITGSAASVFTTEIVVS